MFDRNVKWILQKHPGLSERHIGNQEEKSEEGERRLQKTWESAQVSCRLLMFHHFFLKVLRRDPLVDNGQRYLTIDEVKRRLDLCHGRPGRSMENQIQQGVKQIKAIDSWPGFFEWLEVPVPSRSYLVRWLVRSVENSARRRYHRLVPRSQRREMFDADTDRFLDMEEDYGR